MHFLIAFIIVVALLIWVVAVSGAVPRPAVGRGRLLVGFVALLAVGGFTTGYVVTVRAGTGPQYAAATEAIPARPAAAVALPVPMPLASTQPAPRPMPPAAPARVRTKMTVEVRKAPSRTAAAVRTVRAGDVLRRFGQSNGWLQVGTDRPEGWVSEGALAPAG